MKYFGRINYTIDKEHSDVKELEDWKEDDVLTLSGAYDIDDDCTDEEAIDYIKSELRLIANAGNDGNHIYNEDFKIIKMITENAIVMSCDDFEELINEVSDGHAGIGFEANNWFFTSDDEYDTGDIYKDLAELLGVEQISIYTDFTHEEYEVVILYK